MTVRALVGVLSLTAMLVAGGCRAGTVRRSRAGLDPEHPAGVLSLKWRTVIHAHELFEPWPEECATGVVVGDRVVLGSRAGEVVGVNRRSGRIDFSTKIDGDVDSEAALDPQTGNVLVGADNGRLYAIDPGSGKIRWSYRGIGAIEQAPMVADGKVFFSTEADKVYGLRSGDGGLLWQYERDRPDGFGVHGHAAPRLHDGRVLAGFNDGFLVALRPDNGEILWARSLAAGSSEFVDVDASAVFIGANVVTASYSGGMYSLRATDGEVVWRLPIEGAGSPSVIDETIFFVAPNAGLHAVDPRTGHIRWRRGLPQAGDVTVPTRAGRFLVFSGSRSGLYIVERDTGRLLQTFYPGRGMCAAPVVSPDQSMIYVLSNGGSLYALALGS